MNFTSLGSLCAISFLHGGCNGPLAQKTAMGNSASVRSVFRSSFFSRSGRGRECAKCRDFSAIAIAILMITDHPPMSSSQADVPENTHLS